MTPDKILVTAGGVGLAVFIFWFFFGKKEETSVAVGNKIDVLVDGGYKPSVIKLRKGQKTTITLLRSDPNSCLEEFILLEFKIKKYLPLNKQVEIEISPTKPGEFKFHCGMNMFHGKVVVS